MISSYEIANYLLKIEAVKLSPDEPFQWASGLRSPIYCDNRMVLSYPKIRDAIKIAMIEETKKFEDFNAISGVATAGIPHGALLADGLHLPFSYVRSSAKSHGRRNKIEGRVNKGDRLLVVEDLISTGGSSINAVESIRESGAEVVGVLAIFTYEFEKAKENFNAAGVAYHTLTNYSDLIALAEKKGYLSANQSESLKQWRLDPQKWSDRFN
jgi:orotate phosphoribosyltransferase